MAELKVGDLVDYVPYEDDGPCGRFSIEKEEAPGVYFIENEYSFISAVPACMLRKVVKKEDC